MPASEQRHKNPMHGRDFYGPQQELPAARSIAANGALKSMSAFWPKAHRAAASQFGRLRVLAELCTD